ncbi:hypothetical protein OOU_Y34scaffold00155g27 [Pyricularia oryzae Y34]|uniref:Polycomb protein VEFS-Box domain-containing protein n=2 Tax=Pyricularia oryzae TaxID=318829 RepID=A0AA97P7D5_PYRO3|nr:hypothetical protein OOU_Y34scaffold00155g27 [Pyricularia oryzae Y34]
MTPHGFRRDLPFLHRNWIDGLQNAMEPRPPRRLDNHLIDGCRPAKKRRLERDTGVYNPYLAAAAVGLPEEASDQQPALCINVQRIQHKDTPKAGASTSPQHLDGPAEISRARCKITIHGCDNGRKELLFCASQVCSVQTYKNPSAPGYVAKINLPKPFIVPADMIMIDRHEHNHIFDLAGSYTAEIELGGVGDPSWPPFKLIKSDDVDAFAVSYRPEERQKWSLVAIIDDICPKSLAPDSLVLRHRSIEMPDCSTDLVLKREILWTTGFAEKVNKGLSADTVDGKTSTCPVMNGTAVNGMANGHVNGFLSNGYSHQGPELTNGTGANGHVNGHVEEDDDAEGELTPNRSLRTRGPAKSYNLKELSDKAHGTERKRRRKLGDVDKDERAAADGIGRSVVYKLPSEEVTVDGLSCCVCGATSPSTQQLRAHFLCHPRYQFDFMETRHGKDAPHVVFVSLDIVAAEGQSMQPRVFQLCRAKGSLDLSRYLDGDDSWVTSRFGPDHGDKPDEYHSLRPVVLKPKTTTRRPESSENSTSIRISAGSRAVVPRIKQRLFHPLSKALLEPGKPVPIVEPDTDWLIQKHRDHLQDFVDIEDGEKEYMMEWDAFAFKEQLSSNAYIVRGLLAFVRAKAPWLLAKNTRMLEFGKHMATLRARGSITSGTIEEALKIVADARRKGLAAPLIAAASGALEPKPSIQRSKGACVICRKPALGPSLLICSNKPSRQVAAVYRLSWNLNHLQQSLPGLSDD